ncbi:hypothetical protein P152DRAFT_502765 [Eremomyces bilateralis CBS 781.70]|uniref:AMP-activated protein kinase glycogen-binding domain-containing protein n=1 Tax=Eremomyces bilateralis CBS 781.70 TaxID=1392243 RepID=A0A6G1G5R0_9PEZI|nr:uncharacterized protein P152DRAFT_502765 [Eremomyces bilateralis CBS 781.70]KAF1813397.1 hypothetical protein P152DRAFT_502765 [Eremomyces bilateralis CBS 781.70]
MGTYTFKWTHGNATEVFVTGTFDDWKKSIQLEKKGDVFEKTVELPKLNENILYKYVVDGKWTTDSTAPQEDDGKNNFNNVLKPDALVAAGAATISSAAPDSTTAQLAGAVPKAPGTFPETPAETPAEEPKEPEIVGVNPIPATSGTGNPIKLAPGEKVPDPSTITDNTVESTVKTDEASYNASDAGPAKDTVKSLDTQGGAFGVAPVTNNMIPESSLPIAPAPDKPSGPAIQSAAPDSTSAALAGAVPKEPRGVPEVVAESQSQANADPEASASAEAVEEKKELEEELKSKVPEEPAAAAATKTPEGVPVAVVKSLDEAHFPHEAADYPEAVAEKKAVEKQLVKEHVPEEKPKTEEKAAEPSSVSPAALAAAAPVAAAPVAAAAAISKPDDKPSQPAAAAAEPEKTPAAATSKPDDKPSQPAPAAAESPKTTAEPEQRAESAAEAAAPAPDPTPRSKNDISPPLKPISQDLSPVMAEQERDLGGVAGADTSVDTPPVTPHKAPVAAAPATEPTIAPTEPAPAAAGPTTPAKDATTPAAETPASSNSKATDKKSKRRSIFGKLKDKLKG